MKRLPLILGSVATVYGFLCIAVALGTTFIAMDRWWDLTILREPGFRIFISIGMVMEKLFPSSTQSVSLILGISIFAVVATGAGVFAVTHILVSRWSVYRKGKAPTPTASA